MAAQIGGPRTFHKKFKFVVEIDGVVSSAWAKCSEISAEAQVVKYREGGSLIAFKEPGLVEVADVTLERGATDSKDAFSWFTDVANLAANSGKVTPSYKRNVEIVQQDRDGTELRRWKLANAWPTKFVGGAWDNEANENTMESVTLAYDFPSITTT